MTTSTLSAADILAMPLAELRERVDLAERLAIAGRHAPAGTPTSPAAAQPVKPAAAPKAATPSPAPAQPAPAPAASTATDDDEAALGGGSAAGDFGGDDDMLADFVEQLSPEDAKAKAVAIAKQVIAKKDTKELASAREIMQKYGVTKVSEVAAGKEVELYNDFHAGFPQYAG